MLVLSFCAAYIVKTDYCNPLMHRFSNSSVLFCVLSSFFLTLCKTYNANTTSVKKNLQSENIHPFSFVKYHFLWCISCYWFVTEKPRVTTGGRGFGNQCEALIRFTHICWYVQAHRNDRKHHIWHAWRLTHSKKTNAVCLLCFTLKEISPNSYCYDTEVAWSS